MTEACVPADDRGLSLGVGLFETILFVDGSSRAWEGHVRRLRNGCAELGLPAPEPVALAESARQAVVAAGVTRGCAAVRLTWTGGSGARGLAAPPAPAPRLLVQAARAADPPAGLALATARVRRNPSSPTSRLKTLSYLDNVEARREAAAAGADEALCLDIFGRVSCAAAGNVFWVKGALLCTPAPTCGVLEGLKRAEVLRAARRLGLTPTFVEATPQELRSSDGAFVTNSLLGCVPILSLDADPIAPLSHGVKNGLEELNLRSY